MAGNTVGEETMTLDRAALRETAERFGNMELEESDRNYVVSGLTLYDMIALCRDYLDRTAPLRVKCGECGGRGEVADYVGLEMKCVGVDCPACHGTGSVERADLAEIRKRFENTPGGPENVSAECRSMCGDIPFLLDLIAAQAREIAELKGKANG